MAYHVEELCLSAPFAVSVVLAEDVALFMSPSHVLSHVLSSRMKIGS